MKNFRTGILLISYLCIMASCKNDSDERKMDDDISPNFSGISSEEKIRNIYSGGGHFSTFSSLEAFTPMQWDEAKPLIKSHKDHTNPISITLCQDGPDDIVPLNGLWIDPLEIAKLIYNTDSPPDIPEGRLVYMMPAAKPGISSTRLKQSQFFTMIIAAAHKVDGKDSVIDTKSAIEYFQPCPPKCPDNFKSTFDFDPYHNGYNPDSCDIIVIK